MTALAKTLAQGSMGKTVKTHNKKQQRKITAGPRAATTGKQETFETPLAEVTSTSPGKATTARILATAETAGTK
jgi:hypothetical protein